jgi:class 3 adenylate cyclase
VSDRRQTAARLGVRYSLALFYAHASAAVAVSAVVGSLSEDAVGAAHRLATRENLIAIVALSAISTSAGIAVGVRETWPTFRWFASGREPTPAEAKAAVRISSRQTIVQFAVWMLAGAVFVPLNLDAGGGVIYVIAAAMFFGGVMATCTGWLLTQRVLRPIIALGMQASTARIELPGVLARQIFIWGLFTAIPLTSIALIVLARSNGVFVSRSASVDVPILVLALIALSFSFRAVSLVARSVSDPVQDVVAAMREVEAGRTDVTVEVYDPSEIGQLQSGFNRMVAGLAERERIRDLFGRYVGVDVAQRALEQDAVLTGDVREAAVLYVDLVGSTAMSASRPPDETAEILNRFFEIVVSAVEDKHGLINKFQGDAVLAVFGAPLRVDLPAAAALATARELGRELRKLPVVDFGIGVSCGAVFAGNIGAENRYEYTVVGDPVNEAARLADLAKEHPSRVLCSAPALASAGPDEPRQWVRRGEVVLRGRDAPTGLAEPL